MFGHMHPQSPPPAGLSSPGACPGQYSVEEPGKTKVVTQCEDGFSNLRYCPKNMVNVTIKVKGEGEMT